MNTKGLMLVISLVLISFTSIIVYSGDTLLLEGSNQNTAINSVAILPHSIPNFGENISIRANITDNENDQIIWANFTLISPNGHWYINNSNGTYFGDFWNSSHFQINETGIWNWSVQSDDNDSINTSVPSLSGSFTITDNLYRVPNQIQLVRGLWKNDTYIIELWTDSREDLNFTIEHNADGNITAKLNTTYLMINSSTGRSYLQLNISTNSTSSYGNHTYNLTFKRKAPLNRTFNIPISIEVTESYGDVEFVSPSDYTFISCPGNTIEHTIPATNNGNYNMVNCHPYLYDDNGTEVSTSTNFNFGAGSTENARVSFNFRELTTHFGVYCTASANGSLDYTSTDPKITFIKGSGCGSSGPGGGGGVTRVVTETITPEELNIKVTRKTECGDNICDTGLGESIASCPSDCIKKMFDFKDIICWPLFACGTWNKSWFINTIILGVLAYLVFFMIFRKPGRLR